MKIALSGKMMSGKTIVADHLVNKYGFIELAFAAKLKEIAIELFDMPSDIKNRDLLQKLGNKMRSIDSQVWIKYLVPYIEAYLEQGDNIVVSDVRFKNELWSLKDMGFKTVRCYVGRSLQWRRIQKEMPWMPKELLDDSSEINLDVTGSVYWDMTIYNDGCSMDELLKQVDYMVKKFREEEIG